MSKGSFSGIGKKDRGSNVQSEAAANFINGATTDGRKLTPQPPLRSKRISLMVTEAEFEQLTAKAQARSMSLSSYLRVMGLGT